MAPESLVSIPSATILIIVYSTLCYLNTLNHGLVHDDVFAIRDNQDIRPSTNLTSLFRDDFWGRPMSSNDSHKSYRPFTVLSFRLNYFLHGLRPRGYHLINVLLHTVVCALFFRFCLLRVFRDVGLALAAAALFAAQPVHVEAVAGVVGRAELLACLLVILGVETYARCLSDDSLFPGVSSPLCFMLSLVSGIAAMLCKEQGITVYGIYVIYDALIACRHGTAEILRTFDIKLLLTSARPLIKRIVIIALVVVCLLAFRIWMLNGKLPNFTDEDNPASFANATSTRLMTYTYLLPFNAWLLLAPVHLSYDWQMGSIPLVEDVGDIRNASTMAFFVLFAALLYKALRFTGKSFSDSQVTLLGFTLLALPFLPATNLFFRVGFVVAERILYMPSLGFCLLVAQGYGRMLKVWRKWPAVVTALKVAFVLLLALMTWRTVARNTVWRSKESLFRSGLHTNPHNAKVHYNWGNFLKDNNRTEEARKHYRLALHHAPSHASSNNNLGTLLGDDPKLAEKHFLTAIASNPRHARAYFNLGNIYRKQGKLTESEAMHREAVRVDPTYSDGWLSLADCVARQGRHNESIELHKRAITANSDYANSYNNLGAQYVKMGLYDEAIEAYDKALSINPNHTTVIHNKARILRKMGKTEEAERLFREALNLERSPKSLNYLGSLLYNTKRVTEAEAIFKEAADLDPTNFEIHRNYAQTLNKLGRVPEAIDLLERYLRIRPDESEARLQLATFLSRENLPDRALKVLEEGGTGSSEMLFFKGNLLKDMNDLEGAIKTYLQALQVDPKHVSALMNLGGVYFLKGEYFAAREKYTSALQIDPNDETIKLNLARLERKMAQLSNN